MVAINYAKDIRVGEQPAKAVALGGNFVWPPLPERLFFRGQSLVYDFIKQRYGMRKHGHFTIVAGASPSGIGYTSEEFADFLGDPESATGSISSQPLTGIDLGLAVFATSGSITQLNLYFLGDVVDSLEGIRFWVDGIEVEGPPDILVFHENPGFTAVAYNNPDMAPWVDGEHHIIAITLDGQELPDHPFEPPYSAITTLVAGETPTGIGYLSEEYAASQGAQELATGSISDQLVSGFNLLGIEFADAGSVTQLTAFFQGDVEESLAGIRIWVDGVEVEGPPLTIVYDANYNATIVVYSNPNMTPWVVGGQYTIAITLDGQELPSEYYYTTEVNDLGIVTRASESTYWGPSGSLLEAAVDEARIQHDPVTGKALGLLIESSATNLIPFSENFAGQGYTHQNVDVEPDYSEHFGQTFTLIRPTTDDAQHRIYRSRSGNGPYTATIFAKAAGYRYLELNISSGSYGARFDLEEGEVVSYPIPWSGGETASASIEHIGGGVYRCQYTNGRANTLTVRVRGPEDQSSFPGDGISGIEIFGLMDEEGTYPTSYIPTTDSPVTRAADNAVIDLSDVLNPDEGTYVVRAVVKDDGEMEFYAGYFDVFDIQTRISFYRRASGQFDLRLAGSGNSFIQAPPGMESGDTVTMAISYSIDTPVIFAVGGSTSSPGSVEYAPNTTINLIRGVGRNASDNNASLESSGIIAGFEYYPRALTEEELARITAFTPGDNS